MQLKKSMEIISQPVSDYLKEVIKKFGQRPIDFEMQPIIQYLLNTVLLSMCGAFEQKIETCKYYCAGIDSNYRYDFLKKVGKSEYKADDLKDIINEFKKISNRDVNSDICLKNKPADDKGKGLFKSVYDAKKDDVKGLIESIIKRTKFEQYLKSEFSIFSNKWLNICSEEYDEVLVLKHIYNKLFLNRHELAHNLKSLYVSNQSFEILSDPLYYSNNYFIKLGLLICFDLYIIELMSKIIERYHKNSL